MIPYHNDKMVSRPPYILNGDPFYPNDSIYIQTEPWFSITDFIANKDNGLYIIEFASSIFVDNHIEIVFSIRMYTVA